MSVRALVSFSALAFAITSIVPLPGSAQGTQGSAEAKQEAESKHLPASLTPDGQPDLQGNWVNNSATPLERPKEFEGRQFLTDAEVDELKARAARIFVGGNSDAANGDAVFLAALANVERYKSENATGLALYVDRPFDNRTSLIVDPPDGKIPPYTPEGQVRRAAGAKATNMRTPPDRPEDMTPFQRCITFGVPMPRPGPFTSYYQIVQSPGYVVIVMEAIHDARIIPLDGRPHLPQNIRTWNGDSVGRWEGKTLVVDTTNFSAQDNFMGSAENLHLVERFTRVAPDEIRYEMTVDDPTTWTKPWTAVIRLRHTKEKIYELACHEGNFLIMQDMLTAVRPK
jgi:hypothetical protein